PTTRPASNPPRPTRPQPTASTGSGARHPDWKARHPGARRCQHRRGARAGDATLPDHPPRPGRALRPHRLRASRRRPARTMTRRALIAATAGGATFASVGVLVHAGPLALARLTVLGAA